MYKESINNYNMKILSNFAAVQIKLIYFAIVLVYVNNIISAVAELQILKWNIP